MQLQVVDLFSGVGGLSLGFSHAGFNVAVALEKDEEIAMSYRMNHTGTDMINADITQIEPSIFFEKFKNNIHVVVGGPPCQGFSQKGNRNILKDSRNFLFKYFYEVVKFIRPKYFLIENVPNLLTAQNGYFKKEILQLFNNLGYSVDARILDAFDFGVPQKRKRAFILGKYGNGILELPTKGSRLRVCIEEAIGDLAFLESGEGLEVQEYLYEASSFYQKEMRQKSDRLHNHVATNHSKDVLERLRMIPVGHGKEVLPKEHLTKSIYSGTWSRMIQEEPSVTITTRFDTPSSGRFTHPTLDRAITVREAARLQSFPDDFIFYGSKSSKMKQVGNAVPPLMANELANRIKEDWLSSI